MARIAVGGFHHETNCFVLPQTDYAYFNLWRDRPPLVRGAEVFERLAGATFALAGFMAEMQDAHTLVPLLWTSGGAGGLVTADAFERIAGELVGRLSEAGAVDAVYLDLHGAMVSEPFEDGEGELLRRVRAVVGPAVPIVISLDYHANVTPEMVAHSDGICAYLTYPHVDRAATGTRAATVMRRVLERGRPTARALRKLPFLLPLNDQCTLVEPSRGIVRHSVVDDGELLTLAYLAGFPPSDLFWCGPAVIAHGWNQAAADRAADALTREIALQEAHFAVPMVTPEDGVAAARRIARDAARPVVIADTQDNPGCGGSADSTGLLKALVAAGTEDAVLGFLCDPAAAQAAHAAGEGASLRIALGGHSGPEGVTPLEAEYRVERLGSGRFQTTGLVVGGRDTDIGPSALLRLGGVRIVVTSKRMQAFDQAPFRHLGIEPARERILALKSTCHFRAEFEPLAEKVIVVLAPGYYLADPSTYPFARLRPGIRLKPLGADRRGAAP
ncbi:MAG TPA: M81 family metallopeptidase [Roseomonas sp.]|jgi:microcystin degradation protein MlrC